MCMEKEEVFVRGPICKGMYIRSRESDFPGPGGGFRYYVYPDVLEGMYFENKAENLIEEDGAGPSERGGI